MRELKFELDSPLLGKVEIPEPIGWDTCTLKAKRDSVYGTAMMLYTIDLSFYGLAYRYLRTLHRYEDVRAEATFRAYTPDADATYEHFVDITLFFDFEEFTEESKGGRTIRVGLSSNSHVDKLLNFEDRVFDVTSITDIKGNTIVPPTRSEWRVPETLRGETSVRVIPRPMSSSAHMGAPNNVYVFQTETFDGDFSRQMAQIIHDQSEITSSFFNAGSSDQLLRYQLKMRIAVRLEGTLADSYVRLMIKGTDSPAVQVWSQSVTTGILHILDVEVLDTREFTVQPNKGVCLYFSLGGESSTFNMSTIGIISGGILMTTDGYEPQPIEEYRLDLTVKGYKPDEVVGSLIDNVFGQPTVLENHVDFNTTKLSQGMDRQVLVQPFTTTLRDIIQNLTILKPLGLAFRGGKFHLDNYEDLFDENEANSVVTLEKERIVHNSTIEIPYPKRCNAIEVGYGMYETDEEYNSSSNYAIDSVWASSKLDLTTELRADTIGIDNALKEIPNRDGEDKDIFLFDMMPLSYIPTLNEIASTFYGFDTVSGLKGVSAPLNMRYSPANILSLHKEDVTYSLHKYNNSDYTVKFTESEAKGDLVTDNGTEIVEEKVDIVEANLIQRKKNGSKTTVEVNINFKTAKLMVEEQSKLVKFYNELKQEFTYGWMDSIEFDISRNIAVIELLDKYRPLNIDTWLLRDADEDHADWMWRAAGGINLTT